MNYFVKSKSFQEATSHWNHSSVDVRTTCW